MPAASAVEVLHKCKWWRTQGYNMHKGWWDREKGNRGDGRQEGSQGLTHSFVLLSAAGNCPVQELCTCHLHHLAHATRFSASATKIATASSSRVSQRATT